MFTKSIICVLLLLLGTQTLSAAKPTLSQRLSSLEKRLEHLESKLSKPRKSTCPETCHCGPECACEPCVCGVETEAKKH